MRASNLVAMPALFARRTLVKSPPELWAEVSDGEALARHLGAFGDIRITRTEPETAVAWEGDRARGTVTLEPSGWGTSVTLQAERAEPAPPPAAPDPPASPAPPSAPRRSLWARLLRRGAPDPPAPERERTAAAPARLADEEAEAVLAGVLDELGAATRRPFSR